MAIALNKIFPFFLMEIMLISGSSWVPTLNSANRRLSKCAHQNNAGVVFRPSFSKSLLFKNRVVNVVSSGKLKNFSSHFPFPFVHLESYSFHC